jgi:hypothetical protein
MVFFYRAANSPNVARSVLLPVRVADSTRHTLMVAVNGSALAVHLDGVHVASVTLAGPVVDCAPLGIDCILSVGQRSSSSGGFLQFTGLMEFLDLYTDTALTEVPAKAVAETTTATPGEELNLLHPDNYVAVGGAGAGREGTTVAFDGSGFLRITASHRTVATFSVALTFRTTLRGYLVAKTNLAGDLRDFGLFMGSFSDRMSLFYTPLGDTRTRVATFPNINVRDGQYHQLLLVVSGNNAQLTVDGVASASITLLGVLGGCTSPAEDCLFFVGARSDGENTQAFYFNGDISFARVYNNQALSEHPVESAPPTNISTTAGPSTTEALFFNGQFRRVTSAYIPGNNAGGAFFSGVPVADCAARCLADQLCLSFDAGRPGTDREDDCFLAHVRAADVTGGLRIIANLDYYERV